MRNKSINKTFGQIQKADFGKKIIDVIKSTIIYINKIFFSFAW